MGVVDVSVRSSQGASYNLSRTTFALLAKVANKDTRDENLHRKLIGDIVAASWHKAAVEGASLMRGKEEHMQMSLSCYTE